MLKIKDNVDLKELEKFGFEKIDNGYINTYLNNKANYGLNGIQIDTETRELYAELMFEQVELFYNLIKADLVEKVSDGNEWIRLFI